MARDIRRVVSGLAADGTSGWFSDGTAAAVLTNERSGARITDVWRIGAVPPDVGDDGAPGEVKLWPELGGLVFRIAEIPPQGSAPPPAAGRHTVAGMHASDTVDLMVIVSGELWGYQEHGEHPVLLKQGDTFVQRGTSHAWENRSDQPCVFAVVLVGATRQSH